MPAATALVVETPGGPAGVHLHALDRPRAALLLGHGAGGGVEAPDLVTARDVALEEQVAVALVEQPYRVAGRRSPPSVARLDADWSAVVERLREDELSGLPLVAGRAVARRPRGVSYLGRARRGRRAVSRVPSPAAATPLGQAGREPARGARCGEGADARSPGRERPLWRSAPGTAAHRRRSPGRAQPADRAWAHLRRRPNLAIGRDRDRRLGPEAVDEPGELAVALDLDELELRRREPPRQQGRPGSERHRRDAEPDLIERLSVGELADEVAAADEPNVPAARSLGHLRVHGPDVALYEGEVRSGDRGQVSVSEHPAGPLAVVGTPLLGILVRAVVGQDPLVGRGAHRHRAHVGHELLELAPRVGAAVDEEQPVERVLLVRDEAVEGRGRVVLRFRHTA